jgi:anti-sigma factor RsiW
LGKGAEANIWNIATIRSVTNCFGMTPMKIDQDLIDRLVDGEANEDERRRIVSALAHDSELCRRVALAFLESQDWHRFFSAAAGSLSSRSDRATDSPRTALSVAVLSSGKVGQNDVAQRRAPYLGVRYVGTALAMACSFAVMFAAVWWFMQPSHERTVETQRGTAPGAAGPALGSGGGLMAENTGNHGQAASGKQPATAPFQMVAVPVAIANDGTLTTVDVPVIPVADGEQLNLWPESAVPTEVLDVLGKSGHVIRQKRQLVPV